MSKISIRNIARYTLDSVDLDVVEGEILTLLDPAVPENPHYCDSLPVSTARIRDRLKSMASS